MTRIRRRPEKGDVTSGVIRTELLLSTPTEKSWQKKNLHGIASKIGTTLKGKKKKCSQREHFFFPLRVAPILEAINYFLYEQPWW